MAEEKIYECMECGTAYDAHVGNCKVCAGPIGVAIDDDDFEDLEPHTIYYDE